MKHVVYVVSVRSINGGEYHSQLDAPTVFATEEAALKWVSQDLCPILALRAGRSVYLIPTCSNYGTEWSGVIQLNGRDFPLGIRVNLTTSTFIGA
jgi:hypothetical protein